MTQTIIGQSASSAPSAFDAGGATLAVSQSSINKKTCDLYEVRAGYDWATICLRKWESKNAQGDVRFGGEILIHSSFGNFNNTWGHCGYDFKEFLLNIRRDSFADKTMGSDAEVYDGPQTFRALVGKITRERRKNPQFSLLDKEGARELCDILVEAEPTILMSTDDMVREVMHLDKGTWGDEAFSEPWDFIRMRPNPQVVGFWEKIWPAFTAQLNAEIQTQSPAEQT